MFDLNADDGSVRKKAYESPIPAGGEAKAGNNRKSGLDGERMVRLHHRLIDLYTREVDRQRDNRLEMAQDEDFYDNIQWSEEDAAALEDMGQIPLVYNVISASIDWVLGTERRTRTDFKVLPRRKEQGKPAERKSQLLKYLSDVNRSPFNTSRAFADAVKVGIGWLEDGIGDDDEDEQLVNRYESWRNVIWDSAASELDLSDARYLFRSKWVDLDLLSALFPKRRSLLERSVDASDEFVVGDQFGDEAMDSAEIEMERGGNATTTDRIYGYQRRRVRAIEGWIRMPVQTKRIRGGSFDREIYDEYSPGHVESVNSGEAEIVQKVAMRMHVAIFTPIGMLYFGASPYRHNRFPLTPIWGKRRGRDGMPYGMVRNLKDIQVDVNKRASKTLAILSSNKVVMDEGAVDDLEEFMDEVSRPNAVIIKKPNKELKIDADRDLAQWHDVQMQRSISMIQVAAGVTDENLGRKTNASSGIAIARRQDQGSLATANYFDNLWFAQQVRGEKQLANVEQFMSDRKQFRITNMRGTPEYVDINDGMPENDITRSKADFIISESDWRATQRQAAVEQLLETIGRFPPEVGLLLIDLAVENMDLPNRDEIVKRIRAHTGQRDPDAEEPTPEEQAQAEKAGQMQQMQLMQAVAVLRKALADAATAEAKADQIKAQTVGTNISTQSAALNAAKEALAMPAAAHVADYMLSESGYVPLGLGSAEPAAPPMQQLPPPGPAPVGLAA